MRLSQSSLSVGLLALVVAMFIPVAFVSADDGEKEKGEGSELHERMEKFEDHLRLLRRSLRDEGQDGASLAALWAAEEELLACKRLLPAMADEIPVTDREAFVRDYRVEMVKTLQAILEVEAAFLSGEREKAQELYKELKRLEKPAHQRFQKEEEGKKGGR